MLVSEVVVPQVYEKTLTEEQQTVQEGLINWNNQNPGFTTPGQAALDQVLAESDAAIAPPSDVVWEFHKTVPAITGRLAYKPSGMLVYYDSWAKINKMSRYHQGAKTLITKRTVTRTSPFSMPRVISPSATQLETYRDSSATQLFGQINASKGIIGVTAGVGLMYYIVHRGRVWPFTLL